MTSQFLETHTNITALILTKGWGPIYEHEEKSGREITKWWTTREVVRTLAEGKNYTPTPTTEINEMLEADWDKFEKDCKSV